MSGSPCSPSAHTDGEKILALQLELGHLREELHEAVVLIAEQNKKIDLLTKEFQRDKNRAIGGLVVVASLGGVAGWFLHLILKLLGRA